MHKKHKRVLARAHTHTHTHTWRKRARGVSLLTRRMNAARRANFAWRLADVAEPLASLSACSSYRGVLFECGAAFEVLRAILATRLQAQEEGALERLHHAVLALCFLTECPRVRASVRRRAIPAKDAVWVHRGAELGKVLDGVHLTACEAGEAEASAGVTGGQAGKGLWAAVPWALTGVPRTLNAVDVLEGLEGVGCGGWRDWAGCLDMATAGDWVKCWTWQRLRIPPSVWCLHDRSLVRVSDTLSAACAPPRLQAT